MRDLQFVFKFQIGKAIREVIGGEALAGLALVFIAA
jgi:hypothetical protein